MGLEGILLPRVDYEAVSGGIPAEPGQSIDLLPLRVHAETVREENRHNAYLFWLTLGWVREQMTFFGQRSAPATYGASAGQVRQQRGGRLLSGRI